jgi:hypothetical protein
MDLHLVILVLAVILLLLVFTKSKSSENFIITQTGKKLGTLRSDFPVKQAPKYGGADSCPSYVPPPTTKVFNCGPVAAVCPTLIEADYTFPADSDSVCTMAADGKAYKTGTKKDDSLIPLNRQKIAAINGGADCTQPATMQKQCTPISAVCPPTVADTDYTQPADTIANCNV